MKLHQTLILTFLLCFSMLEMAQAQVNILNRAKRKLEDRANREVDRKIDKTIDKAIYGDPNAPNTQNQKQWGRKCVLYC